MVKGETNSKQNIIKYLPVVDSKVQWGMHVSGIGYQSIAANSPYPIKGHPIGYTFNPDRGRTMDEYAIVYITKGNGSFSSIGAGENKISQGDLFFIFPGQWHTYKPELKTGWDEYWVAFSGNYFKIIEDVVNKSHPIIHLGLNDELVKLFREMQNYAQTQRIGFQQVICGILMHIIGLIYTTSKDQTFEKKDAQRVQQACIAMRENVYNKIKPEDIAESLNMSYSSFRKLFKQYTGLAPLQYILQLKLERIKELLLNTDMSMQDISTELGFESSDYFSFFFRSKTGINPLAYRKGVEAIHEEN